MFGVKWEYVYLKAILSIKKKLKMNTHSTEKLTLNTCEMTSVLMFKKNIQMTTWNITPGTTEFVYNMSKF